VVGAETRIEISQVHETVDQEPGADQQMNETATSAMTSVLRNRLPRTPAPASRPPSFKVSFKLKWDA